MKIKEDFLGSFIDRIRKIEKNGIQADRQHLKCNMYTQFSDPFEFAREYAVNSYDAGATECCISGRETKSTVTVTIRDNGSGMSLTRLQDYFKIFRSRKDDNGVKPIGRFGVGKLSVAAVPGLLRFAGITSTGTECWRFETDSLIDDQPVILERIEPVPLRGTKFEITFKKEQPLKELLERIYRILYRYVRHLDIEIWFDLPVVDKEMNPLREKLPKGNWLFDKENLGKSYSIDINGTPAEIIMGIGNAEHEIYQNKVYITSSYNLVSFRSKKSLVPNLKIRVNSEGFQLTFGRHCLSDERILYHISDEISERILPDYFQFLRSLISEDFIIQHPDLVLKIEEMAIGLIELNSGINPWCSFKIFKAHGMPRLSYMDLSEEVKRSGVIYSEARDNEGADYTLFDGPVLMDDQPRGGLELIRKMFTSQFINLNEADVVIEAPYGSARLLSPEEKLFERYLVYKPKEEVLSKIMSSAQQEKRFSPEFNDDKFNAAGICEEARIAGDDFNSIAWKVNYLVEKDGVTPCHSRRFLFTKRKIILNLYHPEIKKFIELSFVDPELSAHWALAMCLSDMKLLPHITADAREDLLLIDAMSRLDGQMGSKAETQQKQRSSLIDFLKGLS
jgi:hypothetical protein